MSKQEKLLKRLQSKPKDFTYDEAKRTLNHFGFIELNKGKISELEASLVKYKNLESTLQNTLVMAQSTADEMKKMAKQEAEQIVKDAQGTAKGQLMEIEQQIVIKTKELEDLKKQLDVYKAKMESLLISQLELLKDVNKD